MKRKKGKKSRFDLRASLILLLIMAVILVSSSYAWFTSNQNVRVSSLDVNVEAKNGLQISVDALNWKSIIAAADIVGEDSTAYAGNTNQIPATLEPVSTGGNVTDGNLDIFYGSVTPDAITGEYMLTATKMTDGAAGSDKYIVFDLFFKVDAATNIRLGAGSKVDFTESTDDKNLQNAARMAFLVEGNGAVTTPLATLRGYNGATDASAANSTYIWEPNFDEHTPTAVTHAFSTYGTTITATTARLPYDGIVDVIEVADNVRVNDANATFNAGAYSTLFATTPIAYSTIAANASTTDIFSLAAGVTKVRVYMWIEGQDVDCENNASGADVTFDLQIEVAP